MNKLVIIASFLLACSSSIHDDAHQDQPPQLHTYAVACFCPERTANCGSWHASTGACEEYHGHSVLCTDDVCDCGCEPDAGQ